MWTTLKKNKIGIFIFLGAILIRAFFLWFMKKNYFFYDHPASDVLYYQGWAKDIARFNFIGTKPFWGLPLYPYFLAGLDRLTLGNLLIIRLFHLLLGSLNCVLVYILTKKIFSHKMAILSGILMMTHFTLIFYDWLLMPVPLLIFLSLIIILCLLNLKTIKSLHELIALGLLIGAAILGDGKFLIFILLYFLYLLISRLKSKERFPSKKVLIISFSFLSVLTITTLRNKIISGDLIFISAQSGLSFYVGNNKNAKGYFENPDFIRPTHFGQDQDQVIMAEKLVGKRLSPRQVSDFWRKQGLAFISSSPYKYIQLLAKKFKLFLTEDENAFDIDLLLIKDIKGRWDWNPYYVLFPLALAGMFFSRRASPKKIPLTLMIISQLIFTLIFFLTNRHRATILPFLIIYESVALIEICSRLKNRRYFSLSLIAIFFLSFILYFKPQRFSPTSFKHLLHSKSGPIYERRGMYEEAQKHYFNALKIYPNDTNTLFNLANTFFLTQDFPKAIEIYQIILQINPIHIDAMHNLAFTYKETQSTNQAIKTYTDILNLTPHDVSALYNLGFIYLDEGMCDEALKYFNQILQREPSYSSEIKDLMHSCHNH